MTAGDATSPIASGAGRTAQKRRTRQALLDAANALLDEGLRPSLEDVAERAEVSRATAYRYFTSSDDLLTDAVIDRSLVPAEILFPEDEGSLLDRVLAVEEATNAILLADEVAVHVISRVMSEAWLAGRPDDPLARPGRRLPLIDAALAPYAGVLGPGLTRRLRDAIALAIGIEAVVTLRDVCELPPEEARATARWAVRALVAAALAEAEDAGA
jgi:AcrR family transcriptional regulator